MAGLLLWASFELGGEATVRAGLGPRRWTVIAIAVGVSLFPPVTRNIVSVMDRVREPSLRVRARTGVAVGVLAACYFLVTAFDQGRDLFPKTHDDQSYLLQMRMLANGRLWMPEHPLADFFDTFYVLVRPKYASFYFPGAALLYVPTIWLGLSTWLMPAGIAGAIVAMVFRVVAELIDGAAGLLAAVILASLSWFRVYSVLLTSHEPMLLLGLLMFWGWLRYRQSLYPGWLIPIGAFAGWAAITRPVDAVCFAAPIGVGLLCDMKFTRAGHARSHRASLGLTALLVVLGAAPFLSLQLFVNHGITGHWLGTPYTLYLEQDQPNTSFGFHPWDPRLRPTSHLRQKQDYYDSFDVPFIQSHQPGNFLRTWRTKYAPMIADVTLPARPLLLLLPLGFVAAVSGARRVPSGASARRVFVGVLPLFVGLYMMHVSFLEHYAILVMPAIILLLLYATRALELVWPKNRSSIASASAVGLCAMCIVNAPEMNVCWDAVHHPELSVSDETYPSPTMRLVHELVEKYSGIPAVILFPYTPASGARPGDPLYEQPVYNTKTAWPDDSRLILAHDLGQDRNREMFAYYARLQPDRIFYRFDRHAALAGSPNEALVELGMARGLSAGRLVVKPLFPMPTRHAQSFETEFP